MNYKDVPFMKSELGTQPEPPTKSKSHSREPSPGAYVLQFGQHRGKRVGDTPIRYLLWVLRHAMSAPQEDLAAIGKFLRQQATRAAIKRTKVRKFRTPERRETKNP